MSGAGKVVCVTGGSGYIASWLVKLLLQRGYTVNASVLDLNDPRQTQHLLSLDGAKERLHLFKADLMEDGAFDALIHGCEGVFHTACPVSVSPTEEEVVGPAVEGTLNVLRSCVKFACVKRVVITSSIVSVKCNEKPLSPDMVVDETWFSDPAFFKEMKLWYVVAKTLAEGAAWKFAKENGIDLVTLHPGLVTGPFLQPTLNLTVQYVLDLVTGVKPSLPPFSEFVDVRDVAHAHIQAFEVPSASGRYLIVGEVKNIYDVLKNLKQHYYPTLSLPEKWESDKPHQVSKMKAEALGVSFIPLEVSLRDTIESLKEKGFLNI